MNLDILILGDYNKFVWPAFIFAFIICSYFYLKTKKALEKQEKLFLKEFVQKEIVKADILNAKKNTTEVLSSI